MNIVIVGWYGTETIGDRAILSSLLMHFTSIENHMCFKIGSIYPFFTERTILEDLSFWKNIVKNQDIDISIFDSRSDRELSAAIKTSDCVVVGGGPLCDMMSMYLVEYALKKAKKYHKKTMVYGCGIGPLYTKEFKKCTKNIIENSDIVILRDESSYMQCKDLQVNNIDSVFVSIDPAVFCVQTYKNLNKKVNSKNEIAINLRDFPKNYKSPACSEKRPFNEITFDIVKRLEKYGRNIHLIGMHSFCVGNDDREILNKFKYLVNSDVIVANDPMTLEQTMECFQNAEYCVGMRFHAVVLQTLLNGNNYILNYTDITNGKIPAFLSQIHGTTFYANRNINLQKLDGETTFILTKERFSYKEALIAQYEKTYLEAIDALMH